MMKRCVLPVMLLLCSCFLTACATKQKGSSMTSETTAQAPSKIQTTSSGLKYEILHEASADAQKPARGQNVTVHYTGWLMNPDGSKGAKFDSSVDRGQKFSFTIGVGQVIRGWDEGVMDMKVGEQRRLIIPADLGYGARGAGRIIPGGATLIFDVELFSVR